jgi:hypothetical protein
MADWTRSDWIFAGIATIYVVSWLWGAVMHWQYGPMKNWPKGRDDNSTDAWG